VFDLSVLLCVSASPWWRPRRIDFVVVEQLALRADDERR